MSAANLSATLLNATAATNSTQTIYALSLDANGTAVQVQNSDLNAPLYFGTNVSQSLMQATVDALRPYPRGLLTNVGMLVANPALDVNTTNVAVFDRRAYHGTGAFRHGSEADLAVVWSWQQALMAAGLDRQLAYCSNSTGSNSSSIDVFVVPAVTPSWWCVCYAPVTADQSAPTRRS